MSRAKIIFTTGIIAATVVLLWLAFSRIKAANAPPTVKIGLAAPFEGHYRSTGYEALFAVKLALQARNQGDGLNGYRVELVALNDFNNPDEAYRQAQALVADPDIVGVVGHFSSDATKAALPVYQKAGLAVVIPWSVDDEILDGNNPGIVSVAATRQETETHLQEFINQMGFEQLSTLSGGDSEPIPDDIQALQVAADAVTAGNILLALQNQDISVPLFGHVDAGNRQLVQVAGPAADGTVFVSPGPAASDVRADEAFTEAYQSLAGFPPPPRAVLVYDATNILLDSIEQAMITNNQWISDYPDRDEVSEGINHIQRQGITGQIRFDINGRRIDAPVWIYEISNTNYPGTLVAP